MKRKVDYVKPKRSLSNRTKTVFKTIKRKIGDFYSYHLICRWLTIIFVILLVIYGVKSFIYKNAVSKYTGDIEVSNYDEYTETLKEVASDIEGMSQYDKLQMGLDYRDGSDTDHDGLTDKEEIEVYGSDPLSSSTAGDLYSDGYKVSSGMNVSQKYEYTGDREFSNNECDEVELEALSSNDFNATVEDYTYRYELDNWGISKIYKGYYLYNFSGKMTINISEILSSNDITSKDISVWVYDGAFLTYGMSDLEAVKYTEDDNIITINYDFEYDHSYYVYITEKKNLINSLINTNKTSNTQVAASSNVQYLMVDYFNGFTVFYPTMDTEIEEEKFIREIDSLFPDAKIAYKSSTEQKIQSMYKGYTSLIPFMETDYDVAYEINKITDFFPIIPKMIFSYQLRNFDSSVAINAGTDGADEAQTIKHVYNNYHTDFDPYEDELPFQNFASKYTAGNCAGISYLTCALYNNGSISSSGSYDGIDWDISQDDNTTLLDKGLSDYKDKSFVDKKGGKDEFLGDGLTTAEKEFVNMIGAFWKQTNDTFDLNAYRIENKNGLSWDVCQHMMDRLDQGKIITASMLFTDETGHEIVLYDYYWITDDELVFRVYDSNIPAYKADSFNLNCDGHACYLQCKRKNNGDGTYDFIYFYWPIQGAIDYCATSDVRQNHYSAIIVSDETLSIYN